MARSSGRLMLMAPRCVVKWIYNVECLGSNGEDDDDGDEGTYRGHAASQDLRQECVILQYTSLSKDITCHLELSKVTDTLPFRAVFACRSPVLCMLLHG